MPRRHLTRNEMLRAVGMIQAGATQIAVSEDMRASQCVISRLWSRYRVTGEMLEKHRGPIHGKCCTKSTKCNGDAIGSKATKRVWSPRPPNKYPHYDHSNVVSKDNRSRDLPRWHNLGGL
ncbi:hypothetical protein RR48_01232 [Papilio machaon]|uniref:Uncharacterized protein n=1 Tax=Papilio machaon TaxID=76193 RepID=A0A0N1PIE9_PAPMA|nr:hypothetical protein RR48_01232 [Papilio machaon]